MSQNKNTKKEEGINLVDLFFYLLSYWYWFVLGVLICGGFAAYRYATSTLVYRADATIIIKDPSNTTSTARLDSYNNLINRTSVSNEILQFKSKNLMTKVVERLEANINYKVDARLRTNEVYTASPVKVIFLNKQVQGVQNLSVTPIDENNVMINQVSTVALNDTISTDVGQVVVIPTSHYDSSWYNREVKVSRVPAASAASAFLSRLMIRQPNDDASILSFSLQDNNRERAKDVLNVLFDEYNKQAVEDKNQVAINTASFIEERLRIIEAELGQVEGELENFKVTHTLMDANETASQYLSETRESNAAIAQIETRIRVAEYMRDYLADPNKKNELIPANTGLEDLRIEGQINQYNNNKIRRDRLLENSSEESPVIKNIDASLETLRSSIVQAVDNLVRSLQVQRSDAQVQETNSREKFSKMPSTARQMLSIERQQNIKETLYMFLLNRREENALTQAMADNNAKIIDSAEAQYGHIAPSKAKTILLGILIGLAIPFIILIGRLFLDTRVRTRKEIEEAVSVPFLGEIPLVKHSRMERVKSRKSKTPERIIYYDGMSKSILTESLRILTTNIEFMKDSASKGNVITLTSFNPGAGKSFVMSNIAACIADSNKTVVMVDCDLRKRSMSRSFGHSHKTKGVSNYLYDTSLQLDSIIFKDVAPGIDLIPAGMVPPNPVELLKRDRFEQMIQDLRDRYDYVLIDNVPVNVVADAPIIARVADTTLFVLRSGSIDRRLLSLIEKMYDDNQFRNLGIVLNGSEVRTRYGHNYGYGYSYGYGYGYGYSYEDKEEA